MTKVSLTDRNLKILAEYLQENIADNYINLIYMINSTDLVMSFSRLRNKFLFLSLKNNESYISLISGHKFPNQTANKNNDYLRKFIKEGHIESIKQLNDDRILEIHIKKSNDIFERQDYFVILEFIPKSANLILLNSERKIVYAFKYKTLDNPHPILNGISYDLPNKMVHKEPKENTIEEIEKYGENLLANAIEKKYKEGFKPLYTYFNNRINILSRKITILNKELDELTNVESSREIGEMLLTLQYDIEELDAYLKSNNIELDSKLSVAQNSNIFFKKYKKEKKKIIENKKQITIAQEELEDIKIKQNICQFLNNEEIEEMMAEILPHKKKIKINKKERFPNIKFNNVILYFGKNSKQNEELSFAFANKDWKFFHIKDYHGPHAVLNQTAPSNEDVLTAAEITLLLSNKEAGEVNFADIKNIKKGQFQGQVIFKNYTTINIKNIRESTKKLLIK